MTHEPVPCYRYPCDTAFRRGTHTPNDDGGILHTVHGQYESRVDPDDPTKFPAVWRVDTVAWDDEMWAPYVYVEGSRRTFSSLKDAGAMVAALNTAIVRAAEANADELGREVDTLQAVVDEYEPTSRS